MQVAIVIIVALLSAYFLLAAFLRQLRLRYGLSSVITLYPPGVAKAYYRKPHMGGLFCFGTGLFLAGIPMLYFGHSVPEVPNIVFLTMLVGFILGMAGKYRDKARKNELYEPRKHGG